VWGDPHVFRRLPIPRRCISLRGLEPASLTRCDCAAADAPATKGVPHDVHTADPSARQHLNRTDEQCPARVLRPILAAACCMNKHRDIRQRA
jgi:hypothetical protein